MKSPFFRTIALLLVPLLVTEPTLFALPTSLVVQNQTAQGTPAAFEEEALQELLLSSPLFRNWVRASGRRETITFSSLLKTLTDDEKDLSKHIARAILEGFNAYRLRFIDITERAAVRFITRQWQAGQEDSRERMQLNRHSIEQTMRDASRISGARPFNTAAHWSGIEEYFLQDIAGKPGAARAVAFFRSVRRRLQRLKHIPVDYLLPEMQRIPKAARHPAPMQTYKIGTGPVTAALIDQILKDRQIGVMFNAHDLALAAERLDYELNQLFGPGQDRYIDISKSVFYQLPTAYLFGRVRSDSSYVPIALSLQNEKDYARIDAFISSSDSVGSVLLTSTRAAFHAIWEDLHTMVEFLGTLIPRERGRAALLAALGFLQLAKISIYEELQAFLTHNAVKFERAPGVEGMALLVFSHPDFPYVFKVARDTPPTTGVADWENRKVFHGKAAVMAMYQRVNEMDRVGRMLDPWLFRNVRLPRRYFSEQILADLQKTATSSVTFDGDEVILEHVYAQRQVIPLDVYYEQHLIDPDAKRRIDQEFAECIRDLAEADIWVGDYQKKNFGVTREGRVVLYDFDDLELVTDQRFRVVPVPRNDEEEFYNAEGEGTPYFEVGPNDIFPQSVFSFNGIHQELSTARYWGSMQELSKSGHVPNPIRYPANKRLHLAYEIEKRLDRYSTPEEAKNEVITPVARYFQSGEVPSWLSDVLPPLEELHHLPLAVRDMRNELRSHWQAKGWDLGMILPDLEVLPDYVSPKLTAASSAQQVSRPQRFVHPARTVPKEGDRVRDQVRENVFVHNDGIDFVTTMDALNRSGILQMLRERTNLTLREMVRATHANTGYLRAALLLLEDQGWLFHRNHWLLTGLTQYQLTARGQAVLQPAVLTAYTEMTDLIRWRLSTIADIDRFLTDQNPRGPPLRHWVEYAQHGFGLESLAAGNEREEFRNRIIRHLHGVLAGPIMISLQDKGILAFMKTSKGPFTLEEIEKHASVSFNHDDLASAFDFLVNIGWARKEAENPRNEVADAAYSLTGSYGVPVSYFPMLNRLNELLYADPKAVFARDKDGLETHVHRGLNVKGSGEAHKKYFEAVQERVKHLFDMPFNEQPQFVLDTGCGDGTYLATLYDFVLKNTLRGRLIKEDPDKYKLWIIGADFNDVARRATESTLTKAGVPYFRVIYGDINDPTGIAKSVRNLGIGLDPYNGLHTNTFLIHNRPFIRPHLFWKVLNIWRTPNLSGAYVSPDPAFKNSGYAIANSLVERNLYEFFKRWKPYITKFGMLAIELHLLPSEIAARMLGKAMATSYHATHLYSGQYIIEVPIYLAKAVKSGLSIGWHQVIPKNLPDGHGAVTYTHFLVKRAA